MDADTLYAEAARSAADHKLVKQLDFCVSVDAGFDVFKTFMMERMGPAEKLAICKMGGLVHTDKVRINNHYGPVFAILCGDNYHGKAHIWPHNVSELAKCFQYISTAFYNYCNIYQLFVNHRVNLGIGGTMDVDGSADPMKAWNLPPDSLAKLNALLNMKAVTKEDKTCVFRARATKNLIQKRYEALCAAEEQFRAYSVKAIDLVVGANEEVDKLEVEKAEQELEKQLDDIQEQEKRDAEATAAASVRSAAPLVLSMEDVRRLSTHGVSLGSGASMAVEVPSSAPGSPGQE